MKIHYKLIEHERTQDAPFVGALISATRCNYNCKNCFNQEVKKYKTQVKEAEEIIRTESISINGIENFINFYSNFKFKCTKIEYHAKTNFTKYLYFEEI